MSIKTKLIELFKSDEKYIQWGYEALSQVIECKPASAQVTLSKMDEYKQLRPAIVPANYQGDVPYQYQGNNQIGFSPVPRSKTSSSLVERIVDCKLGKVPVYADDVDLVEKRLLNGLGALHQSNTHLLGKFQRVYSFANDGVFIVQDTNGYLFASTKPSYERKYKSYLKSKEQ